MEKICINCEHCIWKYDMFLCMRENMPEPVGSGSTCDCFVQKKDI